jgi:nucleotidyltransferase substrate binding protein (TIGR01987 family)
MNNDEIRWVQRFQNFSRAFILLRSAVEEKEIEDFSELEQEGIIQRFEYSFELAWKTLKDYLEYSGINLTEITPRNVIKEAGASGVFTLAGIVPDVFLDMLLARNALSHTYDFEKFKIVLQKTKQQFLAELEKLHQFFLEKRLEND